MKNAELIAYIVGLAGTLFGVFKTTILDFFRHKHDKKMSDLDFKEKEFDLILKMQTNFSEKWTEYEGIIEGMRKRIDDFETELNKLRAENRKLRSENEELKLKKG